MQTFFYDSPFGLIKGMANNSFLISLQFTDNKEREQNTGEEDEVIQNTKKWLDGYFSHKFIDYPPLFLNGTEFQKKIWNILLNIPFGITKSYKNVKDDYLEKFCKKDLCCRAVGHAIALNPIALVIPCHRVIRSDGHYGNYAGGAEIKKLLLEYEKKGG